MKKFIFLFVIVCSSSFYGQEHAFKINPVGFTLKGFEASYETAVENNNSFEIVFAYSQFDVNDNKDDFKSMGLEIKYKFFFKKDRTTFEGYYIAPVGTYATADRKSTSERVNLVGFGAITGYQWIFQNKKNKGFLLDLNLGLSNYFVNAPRTLNTDDVEGIKPRVGISLGYAF